MSAGCLNLNAVNYNSSATSEDYSCKYLIKHDGTCHLFEDVLPANIVDKSFTLSYSVAGQSWVFFHDYIRDFYMHTRENLYSFKNNLLSKHHEGAPGDYGEGTKPFFIDLIFRDFSATDETRTDLLLEDVKWITEYLNTSSSDQRFNTLTHISVWNSYQHTGRIPLTQIFDKLKYTNIRRTMGEWSFNAFRDILIESPGDFIGTLFEDYALDGTKIDDSPVWYNQKHMEDSWFCIRFEFDNTTNAKVILHDTTIQALKLDR